MANCKLLIILDLQATRKLEVKSERADVLGFSSELLLEDQLERRIAPRDLSHLFPIAKILGPKPPWLTYLQDTHAPFC